MLDVCYHFPPGLTFPPWPYGAGESAVLILDEMAAEYDVLTTAGVLSANPGKTEDDVMTKHERERASLSPLYDCYVAYATWLKAIPLAIPICISRFEAL